MTLIEATSFDRLQERLPSAWAVNRPAPARGRGEDPDQGLTSFGRDVVRECERCGIVVDLAHGSQRTMHEGILASKAPSAGSSIGAYNAVAVLCRFPDAFRSAVTTSSARTSSIG